MDLLGFLLRPVRASLSVAVVASATSGVASLWLVAIINWALGAPRSELSSIGVEFAMVSALALAGRWLSEDRFARLGQDTLARLRVALGSEIGAMPYREFELAGVARLNAALTDDAGVVAHGVTLLPGVFINGAVVLAGFAYLASLSLPVFGVVALFVAVGSVGYLWLESLAVGALREGRAAEDEVHRSFQGLLQGAKELRLHAERRRVFGREALRESVERVRSLRSRGLSISVAASSAGAILFFVVIGLVLFGVSEAWALDARVLRGYALVFLYIAFPLESLLGTVPALERSRVSLERLRALFRELGTRHGEQRSPSSAAAGPANGRPALVDKIELRGVTHTYRRENEEGEFVLGPVDLELRRGELLFIVGGNGSGKTTLAKLLVGLYAPHRGQVLVDGQAVDDSSREAYRQHFSAVFSDFHLFESLYALETVAGSPHARALLAELGLDGKVQVSGGRLSTTSLSQGQRKRLAFWVARLEDRPCVLFDEWAADQDPAHKELFYRELLPALTRAGKAVVAITHDDRYFGVADRCLKLDAGKLVELGRGARAIDADSAGRRAGHAVQVTQRHATGE